MKNNVIKELSTSELQERLAVDKIQLNKMKINHAVTPLENPNKIKEARRDVARIKTELRKRELDSKSVDNK
ncbi:MAG: 50S ribosomal protein L29 [Bacteroidales bacterium]|jgi:large subunit ribosomal protein L29|nr:rpmC [Bacteroidota bacterium]MCK9199431.1 50S ribosomal protein L29 [Bacilli bacterium]MCK9320387.1 50S ribosomal protein L29 [Bacteroidales bacterium]MEA4966811.1 50S ribosomal protein L29 [Bacteroidaceae bacterium]NCC17330.1 50S ribosomal protein L29 [Bacteroidia bacterium]